MKQFSNTYIFIFSSVMVLVVAAILSVISIQLNPIQNRNVEIEKMKSILASVRIESTAGDAMEKYKQFITNSYVVDVEGNIIQNKSAFNVDMKKELSKIQRIESLRAKLTEKKESPFNKFMAGFIQQKQVNREDILQQINNVRENRELPVYIAEKNGDKKYVFPVRGKGLWGPIWGYVSLKEDFNTIYGVTFDHQGETPGLGAEINTDWFEDQFKNKKLFKNGEFVSISVVKGGAEEDNKYVVDGISGGTITSQGLEEMLFDCLKSYEDFFNLKKQENE